MPRRSDTQPGCTIAVPLPGPGQRQALTNLLKTKGAELLCRQRNTAPSWTLQSARWAASSASDLRRSLAPTVPACETGGCWYWSPRPGTSLRSGKRQEPRAPALGKSAEPRPSRYNLPSAAPQDLATPYPAETKSELQLPACRAVLLLRHARCLQRVWTTTPSMPWCPPPLGPGQWEILGADPEVPRRPGPGGRGGAGR